MSIEYTISGNKVIVTEEVDTGDPQIDKLPSKYSGSITLINQEISGLNDSSFVKRGRNWCVTLKFQNDFDNDQIKSSVEGWIADI